MTGSSYLCTNQPGSAHLNGKDATVFTDQGVTSYSWRYYGALQSFYGNDQSAYYNGASSPGSGVIYANNVTNVCGSVSPSMFFQVVSCFQSGDTGISMQISLNPSLGRTNVKFQKDPALADLDFDSGVITIYDISGKRVFQQQITGVEQELDLSVLKPDIYFMEAVFGDRRIHKKVFISR